MKYRVLNWFNGKVAYIADVSDDLDDNSRKGAAIVWSKDNNESCAGCNLSGASVSDEDFTDKSFKGADLSMATFVRCNFSGANFQGCDLKNATFQDCFMGEAKMTKCEMQHARFYDCKMKETDFTGSHIQSTEFNGSDLSECRLYLVHGVNEHIKCMQIEGYSIVWTSEHMYIGCNYASIEQVFAMGPEYGTHYGGEKGLDFWTRSKDMVVGIVSSRPASPVPTGRRKTPKRRI